jgi:hypothetical protein
VYFRRKRKTDSLEICKGHWRGRKCPKDEVVRVEEEEMEFQQWKLEMLTLICVSSGSKLAHSIIENKLAACVNQIPGSYFLHLKQPILKKTCFCCSVFDAR